LTVAPDSKVTFDKPTKKQIYEKLEELAELQKKGLFKLDRAAAIGTPEHFGRVRGISFTLPWGKSFREHRASYRKRDRYKKGLEDKMREIAKQELVGFFI
jgi:hypothetical protein